MRLSASALVLLACSLPSVISTPAYAEGEAAAAEALFREGRALMKSGKLAEGCAKLGEAMRLDPTGMTALTLGECLEAQGRKASAWARYVEAREFAVKKSATAKLPEIDKKIAAVEAQLGRVRIKVRAPVDGLEVRRDDVVVGSGAFDSAVPVDAGSHTVVATAPGRKRFEAKVTVRDGATEVVDIPLLEPSPGGPGPTASAKPPPTDTAAPPPSTASSGGDGKAYVALGAGVVLSVVGVVFLARRSKDIDDIHELCPDTCTRANTARKDDLRSSALTNTVIGGGALAAGLTGLGLGGYWLFAKKPSREGAFLVSPGGISYARAW